MRFSDERVSIRRILALFSAAVMLTGMLTGCGNQSAPAPAGDTGDEAIQNAEARAKNVIQAPEENENVIEYSLPSCGTASAFNGLKLFTRFFPPNSSASEFNTSL